MDGTHAVRNPGQPIGYVGAPIELNASLADSKRRTKKKGNRHILAERVAQRANGELRDRRWWWYRFRNLQKWLFRRLRSDIVWVFQLRKFVAYVTFSRIHTFLFEKCRARKVLKTLSQMVVYQTRAGGRTREWLWSSNRCHTLIFDTCNWIVTGYWPQIMISINSSSKSRKQWIERAQNRINSGADSEYWPGNI
jgi:hypothetical protein